MSEFQKEFFQRTDKKGLLFGGLTKLAYLGLQNKFDEILGV